MRFVIPLLLSAVFVVGTAAAQPSGTAQSGTRTGATTMPLSPDNCGTPDEPKACPGMRRGHRAARHNTPTTQKQ